VNEYYRCHCRGESGIKVAFSWNCNSGWRSVWQYNRSGISGLTTLRRATRCTKLSDPTGSKRAGAPSVLRLSYKNLMCIPPGKGTGGKAWIQGPEASAPNCAELLSPNSTKNEPHDTETIFIPGSKGSVPVGLGSFGRPGGRRFRPGAARHSERTVLGRSRAFCILSRHSARAFCHGILPGHFVRAFCPGILSCHSILSGHSVRTFCHGILSRHSVMAGILSGHPVRAFCRAGHFGIPFGGALLVASRC